MMAHDEMLGFDLGGRFNNASIAIRSTPCIALAGEVPQNPGHIIRLPTQLLIEGDGPIGGRRTSLVKGMKDQFNVGQIGRQDLQDGHEVPVAAKGTEPRKILYVQSRWKVWFL